MTLVPPSYGNPSAGAPRIIEVRPFYKQHLAYQYLWDQETSFLLYGGGAGGGKSWLGCEWLITSSMRYPGIKSFIARERLKTLKNTTLITFGKVCRTFGLKKDKDYKINLQDSYIEFANGSRIDLLEVKYNPSDPLYEDLGSSEYTFGWIEEGGEIHFNAFDTLKSRVGRHMNDKYNLHRKILITCNPKKNWLYNTFYLPWRKGTLLPGYAFLQSLHGDNTKNESGYFEALNDIRDPVRRQRLIKGIWEYEAEAGTLFDYDAVTDLWSNTIKETVDKYMTVDVARKGQDKTVIYYWRGFNLYKKEVYSNQGTDITALRIKEGSKAEKIPYSHILIDEDGIGCLVKGIMVLTCNGWKKVEDIKIGEFVYSKDKKGQLIRSVVIGNKKRELTQIIEDKSGIAFSFSHFLPARTRSNHSFKMRSWDSLTDLGRVEFDTQFKWKGLDFLFELPATSYTMPNGGKKTLNNALKIKSIDFASFLGWFISEGCFDDKYIRITQSEKSIYNKDIRSVLDKCGFVVYEKHINGAISYIIANKNLTSWLKSNCYSSKIHTALHKKIPNIIRNASKIVIDSFLHSFNQGDGYIHKDERMYSTSSRQLAYDINELILKIGKLSTIHIKHKKGSFGVINGRKLFRTTDNYLVSELKGTAFGISPDTKRIYDDHVYNLEIDSPTKVYMVMFDKKKPFFVHNGGVIDQCKGTQGFVNNSSPLPNEEARYEELEPQNFSNLKTQCAFIMSRRVNKHEVCITIPDIEPEFVEEFEQELAVYREKTPDDDMKKIALVGKDEMKLEIGRSPDYGDAFIMRAWFTLKRNFHAYTKEQEMSNEIRRLMNDSNDDAGGFLYRPGI